ncbi:MAG TPA: CCA tRNA nucleotidyltransferase [Waddliaceae bacterium]
MQTQTYATQIVRKLTEAGYIAYFAGGWVRDQVMKNSSSDIDIATNALPQEIIRLFPKTIPVGVAFGVVIVVIDRHQFEVSTFRKDCEYVDGRRPAHVEPSNPQEDAKRRDFTINGMFFDPLTNTILDYVGGQEDIKNTIIRTIGEPRERFKEDRLRMIRAVRFAARFGFTIEKATEDAIREKANQLLPAVSMERIWQEIKKMAENAHFDAAIMEMEHLGLLSVIFPKLSSVSPAEIKRRVACFQRYPEKCPPILFVSELFQDAALETLLGLCEYLKVSNQDKNFVEYVFRGRELIKQKGDDRAWAHYLSDPRSQISIRVIASGYPDEKEVDILETYFKLGQRLKPHIERIIHKTLLVDAEMLKGEGIKPGKLMGDLLREAETIAINKNLENPQKIMTILKKSPLWKLKA